MTFAPIMPLTANVDLQGFEGDKREPWAVEGEIVYRTCDKRLTCSDRQTDVPAATRPDFQSAAIARAGYHLWHGACA
jgi:hypothetical protein